MHEPKQMVIAATVTVMPRGDHHPKWLLPYVTWCRRHCKHRWRRFSRGSVAVFMFESLSDAGSFKAVWGLMAEARPLQSFQPKRQSDGGNRNKREG